MDETCLLRCQSRDWSRKMTVFMTKCEHGHGSSPWSDSTFLLLLQKLDQATGMHMGQDVSGVAGYNPTDKIWWNMLPQMPSNLETGTEKNNMFEHPRRSINIHFSLPQKYINSKLNRTSWDRLLLPWCTYVRLIKHFREDIRKPISANLSVSCVN